MLRRVWARTTPAASSRPTPWASGPRWASAASTPSRRSRHRSSRVEAKIPHISGDRAGPAHQRAGGDADHRGVGGNVVDAPRARAHDGAFADADALQYGGVAADP